MQHFEENQTKKSGIKVQNFETYKLNRNKTQNLRTKNVIFLFFNFTPLTKIYLVDICLRSMQCKDNFQRNQTYLALEFYCLKSSAGKEIQSSTTMNALAYWDLYVINYLYWKLHYYRVHNATIYIFKYFPLINK